MLYRWISGSAMHHWKLNLRQSNLRKTLDSYHHEQRAKVSTFTEAVLKYNSAFPPLSSTFQREILYSSSILSSHGCSYRPLCTFSHFYRQNEVLVWIFFFFFYFLDKAKVSSASSVNAQLTVSWQQLHKYHEADLSLLISRSRKKASLQLWLEHLLRALFWNENDKWKRRFKTRQSKSWSYQSLWLFHKVVINSPH